MGPPPAPSAEPVNDHVNIAGNPPHRKLGYRGGISRPHGLAPQILPRPDVLATLILGSQRHHGGIMTANPLSSTLCRSKIGFRL
jgi:hypothetical protein